MFEKIVFFLIMVLTFIYVPFTGSLLVPTFVRIGMLVLLVCFVIAFTFKKKVVFWYLVALLSLGIFYFFTWLRSNPGSIAVILYFFAFVSFVIGLITVVKRAPRLANMLILFYFSLVIALSVISFLAFVCFNANLAPFQEVNLGGFDFYHYYYNPFLGYINPKEFGFGMVGRASTFMFEPSYIAWFLTTNYFLLDKYVKTKGVPVMIAKGVVLLGSLGTFSTAAMVTFAVLFMLQAGLFVLRVMGVTEKRRNLIVWTLIIMMPIAYLLTPKDMLGGAFGDTSSLGDREGRMQNSLLILAGSGIKDLALGHGPGYIEMGDSGKGESNQYMKLIVEQGILLTILILVFIVYCTRHNKYFMLATLIYLNSVVILWTPLFLINILICKWQKDHQNLKA